EVERSLANHAKRGGDVEFGHMLGTDRKVDQMLGVEKVEGQIDGKIGAADTAHWALVAARLNPFFLLIKLLGALCVVLALAGWLRRREPTEREPDARFTGVSGALVLWVLMFDASGWLMMQMAVTQTGVAAFTRY